MVETDIIRRVRSSVFAVGYVPRPAKYAILDPNKSPDYTILGTGFLISRNLIITNRHVVEGLIEVQTRWSLPMEQLMVSSVSIASASSEYPGRVATFYAGIMSFFVATDPDIDIAIVQMPRVNSPELDYLEPLRISDPNQLELGSPIAMLGYPYGEKPLIKNRSMYRFGPVLQQGFVSALAPFDGPDPTELLLDIRTAGGMSGSPVFLPEDGSVVGIHYGSWNPTIAMAIPLYPDAVKHLLEQHKNKKPSKPKD